ncbi:glycosyltransferase family 39 protein [Herbaspirillum sp. RTI4]|uniref:glycosyltransferase family 39 protein n=1 Tax=Herbaspirillum sp. RTI4 TaxID=3048640 RepID=UPI002AB497BF|nr:glycosyltransferase family 39 protein [Herbaspirillum sp. RTI4]MDY7577622.1 glycosyltransferase family 39 protein [Herbaspirillum sp. RTI4]MEA9982212.1 glycosyltransferase family 39 protein [Herbaspirillum sp. RTI4]
MKFPKICFTIVPASKKNLLLIFASLFLISAIYGTTPWWGGKIWAAPFNRDAFSILIAGCFVGYLALMRLGLPPYALLLSPFALCVGMTGLAPLTSLVWIWACATLIGAGIAGFFSNTHDSTWSLRHAALGFAAIGTLISALAHFPINIPILYFSLFSALGLIAAWRLGSNEKYTPPLWPPLALEKHSLTESLMLALVLTGVSMVTVVTTLPELGYDALAFHLNISAKMLETGIWHFDVTQYIWSVMPFGADWLFVPSFFLAGEQGARLLNSSFLLATAFLCYRLLLPRTGKTLALAAPALLLTLPLSFLEVGSAFIEAPLAFFFLIALAELLAYSSKDKGRWLVLGVALGFASSIKLIGLLIVPFILIGALLRARAGKFERISMLCFVIACLAFLICASSPYLVALWKTGNPVFPLYNSLFRSADFLTGAGSDFSNPLYEKALGLKTFWDMSIQSERFGEFQSAGALGIGLLVLFPLSVLVVIVERRWWVMGALVSAVAYWILVFQHQAYLRYVFPVIPWFLVIGVWALSRLRFAAVSSFIIVMILCLVNVLRFPVAYWPLQQFALPMLWDRGAVAAFRLRSRPELIVGDAISRMGGYAGKKIVLLGVEPVYSAFPEGTVADNWHSWTFFGPSIKDVKLRTSIARVGGDIVVHSVGRGYSREAELMSITTELFRVGDLRVGQIRPEEMYLEEHILNGDFSRGGMNWQLNGAKLGDAGMQSSFRTPVRQEIQFKPFNLLAFEPVLRGVLQNITDSKVNVDPVLLEIHATCHEGGAVRATTQWKDAAGRFISEDVMTYPCAPKMSDIWHPMLKPGVAVGASVSVGSSDERLVNINKISVRTTE